MQKRAKLARPGSRNRWTVWSLGLFLAFGKADGLTVAPDLGCSGEAMMNFSVVAGQIGPKGTSAVISACRTGRVNQQDPLDR
jgi:hypothetical protein